MRKQPPFPSVGDKLKFLSVPEIYYPMYTNMKDLAEKNLQPNQICTVRKVTVHSSWCAVWLEEIPGEDNYLNLCFFGEVK
jgi:hypothetical protein